MSNTRWPLIALCLACLVACRKPPVVATPTTPPIVAKSDSVQVPVQEIEFRYFNAKAKISIKDPNQDQSATVNIRMRQDSVIWLLVNKVGIEGFRALITRDSIQVINRVDKDRPYTVYDFAALSRELNFNVSFDLLQALLLGNLPLRDPVRRGVQQNDYYLLQQRTGQVVIENFVSVGSQKLEKVQMTDVATQNALTVNYANFAPTDQRLYPYNVAFYLKYRKDGQEQSLLITIETSKAEFTDQEQKFPFNVPRRFQK